nr:RecName: Full=Unknown protein 2 [Daucus carota]
VGLVFNPYNR